MAIQPMRISICLRWYVEIGTKKYMLLGTIQWTFLPSLITIAQVVLQEKI